MIPIFSFGRVAPALLLVSLIGCDSPLASPEVPSEAAFGVVATLPAPGNLTATPLTGGRVELSWTDNSADETRFVVRRRTPTAGGWTDFVTVKVLPANSTGWTDATVDPVTQYRYRVRACTADGCSPTSPGDVAEVFTLPLPPLAPSNFGGSAATSTRIDLAWTDESGNETGFVLERRSDVGTGFGDWIHLANLPLNTKVRSDTGLLPGGRYRYRLRACNTGGCSNWVPTETIGTTLLPPEHVESVTSNTTIDLTFSDVRNVNVARYHIQRRTRSGDVWGTYVTLDADLPPGTTTYHDSGLTAQTQYQYRLRTCSSAGCSAWSPVIWLVTSGGGRSSAP
jgi:hypothetical protein